MLDKTIPPSESYDLDEFMDYIKHKNPSEPEYHQAVEEFAKVVLPYIKENPKYQGANLLKRLTEPDRLILFRVTWEDDEGNIQVNRGYRVQHSNAIGPYKGGLRFHPSVNTSVLAFLAFEQTFKNSLTGLPMGGAKGGSDFDPKGKSDREIMRFCQSFMTELQRHIGPHTDVPAGDIGVGGREISYLYGFYKRMHNLFTGVLTGKPLEFGGSEIRAEATGYGTVYFMEDMLRVQDISIKDKICTVSGSGNVAQFATEKITQHGGKVVTLSDSSGFIYDPDGIDKEKLAWVTELKEVRRGRIKEYADHYGVEYFPGERPWKIPCDLAFPCATQNEIELADAEMLVKNGCIGVSEGANMPSTNEAVDVFLNAKLFYGPAKAANAGGVAISGLEMSQNSLRMSWTREQVNDHLGDIMRSIHDKCLKHGKEPDGYVNYLKGANIAGFKKVANALLGYGVV